LKLARERAQREGDEILFVWRGTIIIKHIERPVGGKKTPERRGSPKKRRGAQQLRGARKSNRNFRLHSKHPPGTMEDLKKRDAQGRDDYS